MILPCWLFEEQKWPKKSIWKPMPAHSKYPLYKARSIRVMCDISDATWVTLNAVFLLPGVFSIFYSQCSSSLDLWWAITPSQNIAESWKPLPKNGIPADAMNNSESSEVIISDDFY